MKSPQFLTKRNKTHVLASSFLFASFLSSSYASLILTGVIDGPLFGGTPKAVELFVSSDIADLSEYGVELVSNAGSSVGLPGFTFSGSALAGDFLYVSTESTQFGNVFGFAPDFITSEINHNGNDDFYIYGPSDTLIDVWGGTDGVDNTGTVADIQDSWAYRNNGVSANTTFTPAEWNIAPVDSLDGLDAAGVAAVFPLGTFTLTPIPEPNSTLLLASACCLPLLQRRRRNCA